MPEIDAAQLHLWMETNRDFVLVDTLPPTAFAKAHLPKAINIISDDILAQAAGALPDRNRTVVVYCASENCKRAGLSAQRLERLGYRHVHEFTGGKRDWRAAGLPFTGTESENGA